MTRKINGNTAKSIAKVPFSFFFFYRTAWSVLTVTMVSTRNDQHSVYDPIILVGFSFITLKSNRTTRSRTVVSYRKYSTLVGVQSGQKCTVTVTMEMCEEEPIVPIK